MFSRKGGALFCLLAGLFVSSTFHLYAAIEPEVPVHEPASSSLHCLWKVEGASNIVYLLGSIHMLRENSYPLPQIIESAFTNCSIAVFETDFAEKEKPETRARLLRKIKLPPGQSLRELLAPKVYASFSNHVQEVGLSMSSFDSLQPAVAMEKLDLLELASLGAMWEYGVDAHFSKLAQQSGMKIIPLESADFAMNLLTSFSNTQAELFVEKSLERLVDENKRYNDLLAAWQNGDVVRLENLLNTQRKEAPSIFRKLVSDRTSSWIPQVDQLLHGSRNAIVIVGAAHLVGPDGLVELLKKEGRKVTQL